MFSVINCTYIKRYKQNLLKYNALLFDFIHLKGYKYVKEGDIYGWN